MMRYIAFAGFLLLAACGARDPYQAKLPAITDRDGIQDVVRSVKPEDKQVLMGYFFRKNSVDLGLIPDSTPVQAKTVGDAIVEQKAVIAEMDRSLKEQAVADAKREAEQQRVIDEMNAQADALDALANS